MTKKTKRRYRRPRVTRYKGKRQGFPSIAGIMSIAGPQIVNNSGQLGTYPAIENALAGNFRDAAYNFAANEVMAFTGFDVGKGTFNIAPPALTYGMPLMIRLVRRFMGRVKVGPINLI